MILFEAWPCWARPSPFKLFYFQARPRGPARADFCSPTELTSGNLCMTM